MIGYPVHRKWIFSPIIQQSLFSSIHWAFNIVCTRRIQLQVGRCGVVECSSLSGWWRSGFAAGPESFIESECQIHITNTISYSYRHSETTRIPQFSVTLTGIQITLQPINSTKLKKSLQFWTEETLKRWCPNLPSYKQRFEFIFISRVSKPSELKTLRSSKRSFQYRVHYFPFEKLGCPQLNKAIGNAM